MKEVSLNSFCLEKKNNDPTATVHWKDTNGSNVTVLKSYSTE